MLIWIPRCCSLLLLISFSQETKAFLTPPTTTTTTNTNGVYSPCGVRNLPTVLHVSAVEGDEGGKLKTTRTNKSKERTLYDVLGAKQTDPPERLKLLYTTLAKKLHPDARRGGSKNDSRELAEINAAWQVLSDPKQRLKYDRELQAKGFAEGIGNFVEFGITTVMPWMIKTAENTVETTKEGALEAQKAASLAQREAQKAVNQGAAEAKRVFNIFELDQKGKQHQMKASMVMSKATKLREQAANLPNSRHQSLQDPDANLSATEAERLMKVFDVGNYLPTVGKDIITLKDHELKFKECNQNHVSSTKSAQLAEKQLDLAVTAEEMAVQRLEEAKQELAEAKLNHASAKKAKTDALQREKTAGLELDKVMLAMGKVKEKVRQGLLKHETKYIERESQNMQRESQQLEENAKLLKQEADLLKKQAKLM